MSVVSKALNQIPVTEREKNYKKALLELDEYCDKLLRERNHMWAECVNRQTVIEDLLQERNYEK